jgi:hypothetical protein
MLTWQYYISLAMNRDFAASQHQHRTNTFCPWMAPNIFFSQRSPAFSCSTFNENRTRPTGTDRGGKGSYRHFIMSAVGNEYLSCCAVRHAPEILSQSNVSQLCQHLDWELR